eukprot:14155840-Alexandrium_andersonii.AAC.1
MSIVDINQTSPWMHEDWRHATYSNGESTRDHSLRSSSGLVVSPQWEEWWHSPTKCSFEPHEIGSSEAAPAIRLREGVGSDQSRYLPKPQ